MDQCYWTTQSTQAEHSRYAQTMILVYDMVDLPCYEPSVPLALPFTVIAFWFLLFAHRIFQDSTALMKTDKHEGVGFKD